jgi:hypothetical protein
MPRVRVIVRAFNKDGYHKDILLMNEQQVYQHDARVTGSAGSTLSGLVGIGGGLDVKDFPEMVRFEIVLQRD